MVADVVGYRKALAVDPPVTIYVEKTESVYVQTFN